MAKKRSLNSKSAVNNCFIPMQMIPTVEAITTLLAGASARVSPTTYSELPRLSAHAAGHEAPDTWMPVDIVLPNHCTAEAVRFCHNCISRYFNPFVLDTDPVTTSISVPIHIGNH